MAGSFEAINSKLKVAFDELRVYLRFNLRL